MQLYRAVVFAGVTTYGNQVYKHVLHDCDKLCIHIYTCTDAGITMVACVCVWSCAIFFGVALVMFQFLPATRFHHIGKLSLWRLRYGAFLHTVQSVFIVPVSLFSLVRSGYVCVIACVIGAYLNPQGPFSSSEPSFACTWLAFGKHRHVRVLGAPATRPRVRLHAAGVCGSRRKGADSAGWLDTT